MALISTNLFAGASLIKDKKLPKLDLTIGQKTIIANQIKKYDKKEETEYIKVEFLCKRTKKKKLLGSKLKCKLVELN